MIHTIKQPAIILNMKRLHEAYSLLQKRRLRLLNEMQDESEASSSLHSLRAKELKLISIHLQKIERFLVRYGFILTEGYGHGNLEH